MQGAIVRGDLNSITVAVQNRGENTKTKKIVKKKKNTRVYQAVNKKLKDINKIEMKRIKYLFFSGQQRTIIH